MRRLDIGRAKRSNAKIGFSQLGILEFQRPRNSKVGSIRWHSRALVQLPSAKSLRRRSFIRLRCFLCPPEATCSEAAAAYYDARARWGVLQTVRSSALGTSPHNEGS